MKSLLFGIEFFDMIQTDQTKSMKDCETLLQLIKTEEGDCVAAFRVGKGTDKARAG
ncbi:MAG: hypothetical protein P4L50_13970 [Anaerolineaceae bacterium]|nr:hypothetical protein [Anaerolineaceae bacterium]